MENREETKVLASVPVRKERYLDSKFEGRESLATDKKEKLPAL